MYTLYAAHHLCVVRTCIDRYIQVFLKKYNYWCALHLDTTETHIQSDHFEHMDT